MALRIMPKPLVPLLDDDRGDCHGIAGAVHCRPTAGGGVKASCSGESEVIYQVVTDSYNIIMYVYFLSILSFISMYTVYVVHPNISTNLQIYICTSLSYIHYTLSIIYTLTHKLYSEMQGILGLARVSAY